MVTSPTNYPPRHGTVLTPAQIEINRYKANIGVLSIAIICTVILVIVWNVTDKDD